MTLLNSAAGSQPSNGAPLLAPPPAFHAGQTQWPAPGGALAYPAMAQVPQQPAPAAAAAHAVAAAGTASPPPEPSRRVPAAITSKYKGVSWDRVRPLLDRLLTHGPFSFQKWNNSA